MVPRRVAVAIVSGVMVVASAVPMFSFLAVASHAPTCSEGQTFNASADACEMGPAPGGDAPVGECPPDAIDCPTSGSSPGPEDTPPADESVEPTLACPEGFTLNADACAPLEGTECAPDGCPLPEASCPDGYALTDDATACLPATGPTGPPGGEPVPPTLSCPDGYTLDADDTCAPLEGTDCAVDGCPLPEATCPDGYALTDDALACTPLGESTDAPGGEPVPPTLSCPDGYTLDADDTCAPLEGTECAVDGCPLPEATCPDGYALTDDALACVATSSPGGACAPDSYCPPPGGECGEPGCPGPGPECPDGYMSTADGCVPYTGGACTSGSSCSAQDGECGEPGCPGPGPECPDGYMSTADGCVPYSGGECPPDSYCPPPGGECPPDGPCGPGPGPGHGGGCDAESGVTLTGLVLNANGDPVSNAFVNVQNVSSQQSEFPFVDETGAFTCVVPPGSYHVESGSPDWGFYALDVEVADDADANVTLTLSYDFRPAYRPPSTFYGATAWGNVSVGDAPVEGLRVNVFQSYDPSSPPSGAGCTPSEPSRLVLSTCGGEGQTGEDGSFVITGLGDGRYDVFIDGGSAGLPSRFLNGALVIAGATNESVLTIELGAFEFDPPAFVDGHVLDSNGDPVRGAEVNLWGRENGGWDQTDDDGHFNVSVAPGTYGMQVSTGWQYSGPPLSPARLDCNVWGGPSGPEQECIELDAGEVFSRDFVLTAGSVITGRVVDALGNPVRAFVNANSWDPATGMGKFGWGQTDSESGWFNATVDPGTYEVRVEPDRWWHEDLGSVTFRDVVVGEGATVEIGDSGVVTLGAGSRIVGFVLDPDGNGVPFVNVNAMEHVEMDPFGGGCCGRFLGWASTNESGFYSMSGIEADSIDFRFESWGTGFMTLEEDEVTPDPGGWTWLNVTLSEGGKIVGFVTDADGLPIPYANVDAFWTFDWSDGARGEDDGTAGDGATSAGDAAPEGDPVAPPDDGEDLPLGPFPDAEGAFALSGSVSYDGSREGTLYVGLMGEDDAEPPAITVLDEAGPFTLTDVPAGRYVLMAFIDENGNFEPDPDEALGADFGDAAGGEPEPIEVTGDLDGLDILLADPPPGGWPFFQGPEGGEPGPGPGPGPGMKGPEPDDMPSAGAWGHSMTDENGYYEITGLANGTFGMFVHPPWGTSYTSANVDPMSPGGLLDVDLSASTWRNFTLGTGGQIRGRLVDADGDAVPSAWVSAHSRTGFGGGEPANFNGEFVIRGVAAGTFTVEIMPPWDSDLGRKVVDGVTVAEGGTTDLGDVVMTEGVRLAGRVVDADGNPVANAWVNAFQIQKGPEPGGPGAFAFGATDDDGEFNLSGLVAGDYGFRVDPQWGSGLSAKFIPELDVPESGLYGLEVVIGGGGWIAGRVVDGDGTPVQYAHVGAWSPGGAGGGGTQTDADGAFNLTGLGEATDYNLDVFPPWGRWDLAGRHFFPVTVRESEGTDRGDVELSQGGTLVGHVEDAAGDPVQFAFVNVDGEGTFGWAMTDAEGNFTVTGIVASNGDTVGVSVQPGFRDGFAPTRAEVVWAEDADGVSDAGTIEVGEGVHVTGYVTRAGAGVSDAEVGVWPTLPYFGPPVGGSTTTDDDGAFTIDGLVAGTFDVMVRPTDGSAGYFEIGVLTVGDEDAWFNVSLGDGADLDVLVRGAGVPLADAWVEAFNPDLYAGDAEASDALGYANFTGFPTGTFQVKVSAPGYLPYFNDAVALVAGTPVSIAVDLVATTPVTIYGNYTNATGSSADFFVVAIPLEGLDTGEAALGRTGATGGFTLAELPPAGYVVKILDASGFEMGCKVADLSIEASVDLAIRDEDDADCVAIAGAG